jgi:uncharacterized protein YcfJ
MNVTTAKAISVLGAVAAAAVTGDVLADGNGHAYGHAYGHASDYYGDGAYVYARVVDVDPMVHYVTVDRPRQQCWNETVRAPAAPFGIAGQTAAGGIIGATIGHILGHGSSRDALTVAGAAAGAAIAHTNAVRNGATIETREQTVQRCETVYDQVTEKRVDGYRVTYVYDGRRYTTLTDYAPGERIQVAVDVRPVAYRVRY